MKKRFFVLITLFIVAGGLLACNPSGGTGGNLDATAALEAASPIDPDYGVYGAVGPSEGDTEWRQGGAGPKLTGN